MNWVTVAIDNVKAQRYEQLHQTVFGGYGTKPDIYWAVDPNDVPDRVKQSVEDRVVDWSDSSGTCAIIRVENPSSHYEHIARPGGSSIGCFMIYMGSDPASVEYTSRINIQDERPPTPPEESDGPRRRLSEAGQKLKRLSMYGAWNNNPSSLPLEDNSDGDDKPRRRQTVTGDSLKRLRRLSSYGRSSSRADNSLTEDEEVAVATPPAADFTLEPKTTDYARRRVTVADSSMKRLKRFSGIGAWRDPPRSPVEPKINEHDEEQPPTPPEQQQQQQLDPAVQEERMSALLRLEAPASPPPDQLKEEAEEEPTAEQAHRSALQQLEAGQGDEKQQQPSTPTTTNITQDAASSLAVPQPPPARVRPDSMVEEDDLPTPPRSKCRSDATADEEYYFTPPRSQPQSELINQEERFFTPEPQQQPPPIESGPSSQEQPASPSSSSSYHHARTAAPLVDSGLPSPTHTESEDMEARLKRATMSEEGLRKWKRMTGMHVGWSDVSENPEAVEQQGPHDNLPTAISPDPHRDNSINDDNDNNPPSPSASSTGGGLKRLKRLSMVPAGWKQSTPRVVTVEEPDEAEQRPAGARSKLKRRSLYPGMPHAPGHLDAASSRLPWQKSHQMSQPPVHAENYSFGRKSGGGMSRMKRFSAQVAGWFR